MEGFLTKEEACKMLPADVKKKIGKCKYKDGWLFAGEISVSDILFIADPSNAGKIDDERSYVESKVINNGNKVFNESDNGFTVKPGSGFYPVKVRIGTDLKIKELQIDFT